mgnify:CR=1 FL=1
MSFPSLGEVGARAGASLQSRATAASAAAQAQVAGLGAQLTSRLQAALKLGQSTRLLQIETALPSASLVVERCRVTEAVHALIVDAQIALVDTDPRPGRAVADHQLALAQGLVEGEAGGKRCWMLVLVLVEARA